MAIVVHMQPVTRWEVWDDEAEDWQHNHIEDGHIEGDAPEGRFPSQSGWKKRKWRKSFGHLDERHVLILDGE